MKYFLYSLDTGDTVSFLDSPEEHTVSFVEGLGIIPAEGYVPTDVSRVKVVNGALVYQALPEPTATTDQIKVMRASLEDAPLNSTKGLFEGDQRSLNRLAEAHKSFSDLPLVGGQLEWRRADNTYLYFTRDELGALLDELATLRAIRTNKLFRAYQTMLTVPNLTLQYVRNPDNWV